ncbi:MAG TPA: phosphoesterase PA-phosphatase, partial [Chitinophagaceae bacterium]|nr:phosphoesterase PA-phosphatase [Chitinophagaceae bacterium]
MRIALVAIAAMLLASACNKRNDYKQITSDPFLYSKTVKELNNVVMQNNFPPIIASRNYLYASIAAYEVIAAGNPGQYQSLAGQVNGLTSVPAPPAGKEIDFNFAAVLAFCKLGEAVTFPEGSMKEYVDSLKDLVKDHGMPGSVFNNTIEYAEEVGKVILAWSKKDNYAQTRTAPKYTVIDTPGRWIPTPPMYSQALEPHWREIRTVVMDSADQFVPPPPPVFN